jgi:TetR/AcrR family transcriptional regulator, transcriptional repressor of aconitase
MPKVTEQYRDARRAQILSAARCCFLRDGFHNTSMQDLFAEAGLSSGAVYRYFSSKDDVIIAIAEENMRDVVEMTHSLATKRPSRSVGAALADVVAIANAKHARDGMGGIALLVWAETLRNPSLGAKFADLLTRMRADLAEIVRANQGSGVLSAGVPADALAGVLVSIAVGYLMQMAILGPTAVADIGDTVSALWPGPVD